MTDRLGLVAGGRWQVGKQMPECERRVSCTRYHAWHTTGRQARYKIAPIFSK